MEIKIPCEVYSRVVGYMRPVSQWNKGKQSEWNDRLTVNVPEEVKNV
jgi:ribonucleoside-triphosphate reductase